MKTRGPWTINLRNRVRLAWHVFQGRPLIFNVKFDNSVSVTDSNELRVIGSEFVIPNTGSGLSIAGSLGTKVWNCYFRGNSYVKMPLPPAIPEERINAIVIELDGWHRCLQD